MIAENARLLAAAIDAVHGRRPETIHFVACGGSLAYMYNQQYIFDRETTIATTVVTSNEFIHRAARRLGPDSLVVLCSHSGNTPETVAAASFARERGALTVAYTHKLGSPLCEVAEYILHYEWGPEADACEHRAGMALRFVFGCLDALAPSPRYARALETAMRLSDVFDRNRKLHALRADAFGSSHKREPIIYTMGSGPVYGDAYSFAICLLQEMQWVHSSAIHSGEFFHGPFEITDYDVPFLMLLTSGATRPLDLRAQAFLGRFCRKITTVDAEEFDWTGVDADLKDYFSAPVFGAVLRVYAERLAEHRGHPLSVRRYMWKMEY